jgi:hypothetical protein
LFVVRLFASQRAFWLASALLLANSSMAPRWTPRQYLDMYRPAQTGRNTEAEHVRQLLVKLADMREQSETLREELARALDRLGVPREPAGGPATKKSDETS